MNRVQSKYSGSGWRWPHGGFTLIELLVVVAIIALSLGVLAMVGGTVLMAAAFLFVGA